MLGIHAELYPKTDRRRLRKGATALANGSCRTTSQPQASIMMNNGKMDFMRRLGCFEAACGSKLVHSLLYPRLRHSASNSLSYPSAAPVHAIIKKVWSSCS